MELYARSLLVVGIDLGLRNTAACKFRRERDGIIVPLDARLVVTEQLDKKTHVNVRKSTEDMLRLWEIWDVIEPMIAGRANGAGEPLDPPERPDCVGAELYHVFEPKDAKDIRVVVESLIGLFSTGAQIPDPETFKRWILDPENLDALFTIVSAGKTALRTKSTTAGRGQAIKTLMVYAAVLFACRIHRIPFYPHTVGDLKLKVGGKRSASKDDIAAAMYEKLPGLEDLITKVHGKAKTNRDHYTDAAGHGWLAMIAHTEQLAAYAHAGGPEAPAAIAAAEAQNERPPLPETLVRSVSGFETEGLAMNDPGLLDDYLARVMDSGPPVTPEELKQIVAEASEAAPVIPPPNGITNSIPAPDDDFAALLADLST